MSAVSIETVPGGAGGYAARIERNEAALERYRAERADRQARGVSVRTSERVIARLEAETTLLRAWGERAAGPGA